MAKPVIALIVIVTIGAAGYFFFGGTPTKTTLPGTGSSTDNSSGGVSDANLIPITPHDVAMVDAVGRVSEEAGSPRASVTVRCERGIGDFNTRQFEEVGTTLSDESGAFSFPTLPVGRYRFTVSEEGYAAGEAIVVLAEGVTPIPIELVLTPGLVIEGTIRDSLGNLFAGATLIAFNERGGEDDSVQDRLLRLLEFEDMKTEVGILATSRDDGTYSIKGLDGERYRIRVGGAGHAIDERRYVASGSTGVDFMLRGGGRLKGTITTTGEEPISGATLSLRRFSDGPDIIDRIQESVLPPLAEVTSNAKGEYLFDMVGSESPYALVVSAKGYQPREVGSIVVTEAAEVEVTIQLAPGFVIQGKAFDPGGAPLAGARCRLQRSSPAGPLASTSLEELEVLTDTTGALRFDTLEDSPYTLLVSHDDFASYVGRNLLPSKENAVEARLSIGAAIQGHVIDEVTGDPLAGAIISTPDPGSVNRTAVSNAGGEYELRGVTSPKSSRVSVSVKREGYEPKVGQTATAVAGSKTSGVDFLLRRNGSISGVVLDHLDRPVPDVVILARRAIRSTGGVATIADMQRSDAKGTFFLEEATPGEGTILEGSHPSFVNGLSEPFAVEPDTLVKGIVLRMKVGGDLTGRVVDADGTPIAGATIGARGDLMSVTDPQLLPSNTVSDENGEFRLRRLTPGDAAILATAPGFLGTQMTGLEVFEAQTTANVVVTLTTGAKVSGFVRDTSGAPIKGAKVIAIDTSFGLRKFTDTTDSKGAFLFDELGPYPIVLEASAKGHGKLRLNEQEVNQTGVEIVLESYGAIRGRVVTSDGEDLPPYNVSPRLVGANGRALPHVPSRSFTSDTFDFGGLVPGTYEVIVGSRGLAPAVFENIVVKAKRFTQLPLATLDQGGKIVGVVYEKVTGYALPGAKITVVGGAENFHHDGTTGPPPPRSSRDGIPITPEGQFEIRGLFYDVVRLEIEHPGLITQLFDVNVGVKNLVVAMLPGGEIEGAVTGPGGEIVASQQVLISGGDGNHDLTTTTDRRGNYKFTGLPPGIYTLEVTNFSRGEVDKGAGTGTKIQSFTATVTPGETVTVNLYYD